MINKITSSVGKIIGLKVWILLVWPQLIKIQQKKLRCIEPMNNILGTSEISSLMSPPYLQD